MLFNKVTYAIQDFLESLIQNYRKLRLVRFSHKIDISTVKFIGKGVKVVFGREHIGRLKISNNVYLSDYVNLLPLDGNIEIGANCFIGEFCMIHGQGGLHIGDDVMIGTHTVIIPANHIFVSRERTIKSQGLECKGIRIEDDCWIGANVTILDGVVIGKGSIVGAGSVVTKSIEEFSIVAGNPAKIIKSRVI